jgi:hypothetical protein
VTPTNRTIFGRAFFKPKMSQSQAILKPSTKLAEACFEFFHIEMVDKIYSISERPEVAEAKLDLMGFIVGQKLGER